MKVNQLIEKVLNKWPVKLICLLVAIFLYIFHQMSLVDTKTFTVPLNIYENGAVIHTNDVQKYVSIIIKADRDKIATVHNEDLIAYINLDYVVEKGSVSVPVNIEIKQRILSLDPVQIKVKPDTITTSVEPKLAKFVPAVVSIAGECAEGYEIDEISVTPDFVEIYGPESIVNSVESIQTDMVNISGKNRRLKSKVGFINNNSMINIDENLEFDVDVKIKQKFIEKSFTNIPVTVNNLHDDLVLVSKLPEISFVVKGSVPFFNSYNLNANAAQVDLGSVNEPGIYTIPLTIILPQTLTLISKSDENITIEIGRNINSTVPEENQSEPETVENEIPVAE